jgi:hypothetical protein
MADAKISELDALASPDIADELPIVDTDAIETKKITWANIVAALDNEFVSLDSSTDNALARFNGSLGQIQNSGVLVDDSNNVYIPATEGSEQAPALTIGNWTLGTGWAYGTSPDRLLKNSDGTGTATPTAATTIVAGITYKVVITVSVWTVGSATFSLGGITSSTALTSAATFTAYITANTSAKLIITPTNTSRFEISAISIIPFVADTGEAIIDGTLDVRSTATFHNQILARGTANASAPSIAFVGATSTGFISPGQGVANTFSMVSNGTEIMWFTGSRLRSLNSSFSWDIQGIWIMQADATLGMHHQTTALSGGARRSDTFTMAANTNQTASTEISSIAFNLSATRQWATGAITTQRELLIQAPTYAFVGASTITNAATVAITGSPTAGTNATITNTYSFWVQGGVTKLDGLLDLSGISAGSPNLNITATSDTPTTTWTAGVPSTDPAGFMEINVGGSIRYIPFWT